MDTPTRLKRRRLNGRLRRHKVWIDTAVTKQEHLQAEGPCVTSIRAEPPDGLLRVTRDERCLGRFFRIHARTEGKNSEGRWCVFRNSSAEFGTEFGFDTLLHDDAAGAPYHRRVYRRVYHHRNHVYHHRNRVYHHRNRQIGRICFTARLFTEKDIVFVFLVVFFRCASSRWVKPK